MKSTRLTGILALLTLALLPAHAAELHAPSGTYATIVEAGNAAARDDIIIVTADHSLTTNALGRDRNLTFTSGTAGVWRTITTFTNQRAFTMTEGWGITLDNLILQGTGTNSGDGGAIGFTGTPPAVISTTIAGNFIIQGFSARSGGAFYSTSAGARLTVGSDGGMVIFRNNKSINGNGGAIRMQGADSALIIRGTSLFESNTTAAVNGGGAIYIVNTLIFEGATEFRNNSVYDSPLTATTTVTYGGAIYNNNTSGAIQFRDTAVFTGNTSANGHGGAMRSNAFVTASGHLTLNNNRAGQTVAASVHGGAFFLVSGLDAQAGVSATANSAAHSGGALYSEQRISLAGINTFTSNTAGLHGGAIAARNGLSITGAASFTSNISTTGRGGAIYAFMQSGTAATVTLGATTGDFTFRGNTASGTANAIFLDQSDTLLTLNLDTAAGRSINFFDPIASNLDNGVTILAIAVNKTGAGTVLFDTHYSEISADTIVSAGTLALAGNATYGSASALTTFRLGADAVLAGSGTVRANTLALDAGATLLVTTGGTLSLRSATANHTNAVKLAGSGVIDAGPGTLITASSVTIGDTAHTTPLTLALTGNLALASATLNYGCIGGGTGDLLLVGGTLTLNGTHTVNFNELVNGTYTLANSAALVNNSSVFRTFINGNEILSDGRSTATYATAGSQLQVTLSKQNAARTWTGAASSQWNTTGVNWAGGDQLFLDGDSVLFTPAATTAIAVATAGVTASEMTVNAAADITFSDGHVKTDASSWQGTPAGAAPTGKLIKNGAGTLFLANDTANDFTGGVTINQGIISIANAAQLGAALSKIEFAATNAAANARVAITGSARFDTTGANGTLAIGAGNHGGLIVRPGASLTIANAANAIDIAANGAFYLDAETGATATFAGNTAAAGKGGFMHLAANATATLNIATGATMTIGQPANAATDTLTSADTTASILKTGAGDLLIHSNNSAYTGATRIAAGTLVLGGPNARLGGAVTIASGARLAGNGALTGATTLESGATLQVGAPGATGTLSFGALTLNGATLDYDLGDLITATSLTLTGTNIFRFTALDTAGTHQLVNTTSITGLDIASIKTHLLIGSSYIEVGDPGSRYAINYQSNATGLLMNLAIANTTLVWGGATGNQWATDGNWLGSDTSFASGDSVIFDSVADTGNEPNRAITIAPAGVIVASMSVDGAGAHTFTGGAITGVTTGTLTSLAGATGKLEKNGPGLLVLDNAENSFAGGITVRSGTLKGTNTSLGTNTITLDSAGTLVLDNTAAGVFAGSVSGPGTVVSQGDGTLTIAAGKTIAAGTFNQNAGTINMDAGAGAINVTHYNLRGGLLALRGGALAATGAFTLGTSGTLLGTGALATGTLVHKGALRVGKASGLSATHATFTINGDYAGDGGVIFLNTTLNEGGATAQTDRLIITGNATGAALVDITNDGGIGGDTIGDGIKVVGIAGANNAELTLARRVIVEVYDYGLVSRPDGFYLQAVAPSPEIPAAGSMTAAAILMGNASFDTLTTRFADLRAAPALDSGLWLAGAYHTDKVTPAPFEGLKVKAGIIQAGYDHTLRSDTARAILGLYFTHTEGDGSFDTGVSIRNRTSGGGVYFLHAGPALHLNIALRMEHNNYAVNTPAAVGRPYDHLLAGGRNLAGTIEAGYALNVGKLGLLEPQAQLTMQRYETGPATDSLERNYTWDNANSLLARAGLRWSLAPGCNPAALHPWLRVSALHEFRGDYIIHVTGYRGRVYDYESDLGGSSCRVDGGLVWAPDDSLRFGLSAAWRTGKAGSGFTVQASANLAW